MTEQGWKPTPREGCPERCQGHFAPCEHLTGLVACRACVRQRTKEGPIFCEIEPARVAATAQSSTDAKGNSREVSK